MLGVSSLAELGANASDLLVDPRRRAEEISLLDRDGSVREFEITFTRPDGEQRTVLDTCYLIRDPETGEEFIHGIVIDITSRKQLEAQLREMSTHDPLTGALNRRYLMEIEESFARDPLLRCGCIFVDIDHFKIYNDLHGHAEGDEVLKRLVRFLMRYTRSEEAVVRFGGDEFVVILHGADTVRDEARRGPLSRRSARARAGAILARLVGAGARRNSPANARSRGPRHDGGACDEASERSAVAPAGRGRLDACGVAPGVLASRAKPAPL